MGEETTKPAWWRGAWGGMASWLRSGSAIDSRLDPGEALELRRRQRSHAEQDGLAFTTASLVALALGIIACSILTPEPPRTILIVTFLVVAVVMASWRLTRFKTWVGVEGLFMMAAPITFVGFGWALVVYMRHAPTLVYGVAIAAMYLMAGFIGITLYPVDGKRVALVALGHFVAGTAAWVLGSGESIVNWCAILLVNEAFALVFFKMRMRKIAETAYAELTSHRLFVQNERLRLAAIEREMEMAAELQDALPLWLDTTSTLGAKIGFFQMRRGTFGGDWMAARLLGDGNVVIAVADVTGKGLAAAMVVQAVQSLWAEALAETGFDVPAWIRRVNRTLCALGHRHPYTLTLGVIVLGPARLSYYTAGHVPAFLVEGDPAAPEFSPIVARGNLLGIQSDVAVGEAHVDLKRGALHGVLLGTDGVFDTGGRIRRHELHELLADLERRGSVALEHCPANDDKLLVWIKLNAA
jgi:hypothetical protein